jgi:hypothetical protein
VSALRNARQSRPKPLRYACKSSHRLIKQFWKVIERCKVRFDASSQQPRKKKKKYTSELGEDVQREGILKTPERAARAMLFLTQGYQTNLTGTVVLVVGGGAVVRWKLFPC